MVNSVRRPRSASLTDGNCGRQVGRTWRLSAVRSGMRSRRRQAVHLPRRGASRTGPLVGRISAGDARVTRPVALQLAVLARAARKRRPL